MVHNREICEAGINCETALQKRTGEFDFVFHSSNDQTVRGLFAINAAYMAGILRAATGLDIVADPVSGKINMIFVNPAEKKNSIGASSDPALFAKFMKSRKIMCLGVNFDWSGGFEYSEVWIKTNQPEKEIANCIKEEIYNTSGVPSDPIGKASIFSDDKFQEKSLGGSIYTPISSREFTVMKVLYNQAMKNGQSREQSKIVLDSILRTECDI